MLSRITNRAKTFYLTTKFKCTRLSRRKQGYFIYNASYKKALGENSIQYENIESYLGKLSVSLQNVSQVLQIQTYIYQIGKGSTV